MTKESNKIKREASIKLREELKVKVQRKGKKLPEGAPREYYKPFDSAFHPKDLKERMARGELNVQIYPTWDISKSTFENWIKDHEDLSSAYEIGKDLYEKWFIENRMNPMIEGKLEGKHSFNASIAIANNKLGWARAGSDKANTQVNINNLQINNNMTVKELTEVVTKDLEYLQNMGIIESKPVEVDFIDYDTKSDEQDEE